MQSRIYTYIRGLLALVFDSIGGYNMVGVCVKKYYRDVPSIRISEVNLRCHPPRKKPPFSAMYRLFASDFLFTVQRTTTKSFQARYDSH